MAGGLVILLRSGDWHSRWLAVSLALTAAACDEEVELALFAEALGAFAAGRFDEGAPPQAGPSRVGSVAAALEEGRRDLGIRVVACDTALRLAGIDPDRAAGVEVTSLPALWARAAGGRLVVI